MKYRYEYTTDEERQELIDTHVGGGLTLIEEHNVTEGNFLVFSTQLDVIYTEVPAGRLEEIETRLEEKDRENKAALFEIYGMLLGGE